MDGRYEGGPEEDGCHKLEDTCTQKRRLEDGREEGQGPTRAVEPWSSSSSMMVYVVTSVLEEYIASLLRLKERMLKMRLGYVS